MNDSQRDRSAGDGPGQKRQACLERLRQAQRDIAPGQACQVDFFRPEDALGVAQLYYATYGETFPLDYVYDPEEIILRNAGPDLHQVVGRTEVGDIVGVAALFRRSLGRRIMEVGSLMVLPGYPGGKLMLRMGPILLEELPQQLGLQAVFGQSVCDHLVSQKASHRFRLHPFAIEIGALPARPEQRQFGLDGRISLLDEFKIFQDAPHTVYLPQVYGDFLQGLYASRGLSRTLAPDGEPGPTAVCDIESMDAASFVRMTLRTLGGDISTQLDHLLERFPDREVLQVCLPLTQPGISHAVDAARAAGFFLAGLLPLWADRDALLMQRLAGPFDPSRICLLTDEARQLLAFIHQDSVAVSRRTVIPGGACLLAQPLI